MLQRKPAESPLQKQNYGEGAIFGLNGFRFLRRAM